MAGNSPDETNTLPRAADLAEGRALLRNGSRSFHLASLLLPKLTREAATALYAFCRLADDAIDDGDDGQAGLAALRLQLDRVYAGAPAQPVERLLALAVRRHRVPRELLEALLEGFEWDLAGRRYETLSDLRAYAARVAGSVGAMMTLLMSQRQAAVLARACDLGVAMQLTNIARDVGQDARAGRLYLPAEWLREVGIDPDEWLARPVFNAAIAGVIERLLAAADELYARSASGIAQLPRQARPGVHAARLLYAEIGQELRRNGLDSLAHRACVGRTRKLALLLNALGSAVLGGSAPETAPLEETRFLLRAVQSGTWPQPMPGEPDLEGAREPMQGRAEWVLELFERIERRAEA
jgi:phytoene synthase